MENCTIYSHHLDFDKVVDIINSQLPKAKVTLSEEGSIKSLQVTMKQGFFGKTKSLKINYRQRENPSYKLGHAECGLTQNLLGMVGYIQSLPTKNKAVKDKFVIKVCAVNCEMSFMTEPEMTDEFAQILKRIVAELNAFLFTPPSKLFGKASGQHFVDKHFNLILDGEGNCDIEDIDVTIESQYHDQPVDTYTEEQVNRKNVSEEYLTENGIKVNANLPCSRSSEDINLQTKSEVLNRAYALLVVAAKGEGVEQEHLERVVQGKKIDSFSPREQLIWETISLSDQERAYATWRYESLNILLWSLGLLPDLKYPSDICDVEAVVSTMFKPSREELTQKVVLRDKTVILDELDKIYRMHWACVDARIKGQEVAGDINPSVIYERHYALKWLTNYDSEAWDDVQTNT